VLSEVCAGDAVLESLAAEAREVKKKLWADSHPVLPWEWRSGSRERHVEGIYATIGAGMRSDL